MGRGALGGSAAILPLAGGYLDQPAAAMDAFAMFDLWASQSKGAEGEA